ncbi:MAG: hypothetical protein QXJ75_04095 [Candidatus Bathyarchaeia archaeon]
MKVVIVSLRDVALIRNALTRLGFDVVHKDPDLVIVSGGDGSILYSERLFPSIPKLAFKRTRVCRRCEYPINNLNESLLKLRDGLYEVKEEMKLRAIFKNQVFVALNEIQVRNKLPTRALRFSLAVNDKIYPYLIGDGVIVSTPFGSSGYYHAAGGEPFDQGIGVCLNNPFSTCERSFVVSEDSKVRVKVLRETAFLAADNEDERITEMREGEEVYIEKNEKARLINLL